MTEKNEPAYTPETMRYRNKPVMEMTREELMDALVNTSRLYKDHIITSISRMENVRQMHNAARRSRV